MGMVAISGPLSKPLFPNPTEAPYEIWHWLAQQFLRRGLKSAEEGACLHNKLAHMPNVSGDQPEYQTRGPKALKIFPLLF